MADGAGRTWPRSGNRCSPRAGEEVTWSRGGDNVSQESVGCHLKDCQTSEEFKPVELGRFHAGQLEAGSPCPAA